MNYLRFVIRRLISDPVQVSEVESLPGDREMMGALFRLGVSKEAIVSAVESYYGVKYVDLSDIAIPLELLEMFDQGMMKLYRFVPFRYESGVCHIALANLAELQVRELLVDICRRHGMKARMYFAFPFEVEDKIYELERLAAVEVSEELPDGVDVVAQAERIIVKGIELGASDIHLESREDGLQLRYRVDGILSVVERDIVPRELASGLISRLKLISGLDIAEKRRPQDGRINDFVHKGSHYDIRVSSVGTIHGEKLVFRILDKSSGIKDLLSLGFLPEDKRRVDEMLRHRYGIIYLGGASGTGKTTTLSAMLDSINTSEINIYTIEDPVEKTMENVNHIQVNPVAGITFASVLRSLLRQDPDVVVVGEIRDAETLELSIRASLTGHLVLTTIHANNAVDVVSRILDMGAEPYLVGASAIGFLSQVLVRVLCPACKEVAAPDSSEALWVRYIQSKYQGVEFGDFYVARGCLECNGIGYRGRTAVPEVIVMDDELKSLLVENYNDRVFLEKLLLRGFVPLELGVFKRAAAGVTSLREAMRILS